MDKSILPGCSCEAASGNSQGKSASSENNSCNPAQAQNHEGMSVNSSGRICPVILCGGSGTRLWPLSRGLYPKQFMDLGGGRTLFKDTVTRLDALGNYQGPIVVCNEAHRFYALEGLEECGLAGTLILEPDPRNTAPAIAIAAMSLPADTLMLVMPADHAIGDAGAFASSVMEAAPLAEAGRIVTFGAIPTVPETGYGYIKRGEKLGDACFTVARFTEKPDAETAAGMLADGGYYWNCGIFLMRADTYLEELERHAPEIAQCAREAWQGARKEENIIVPAEIFTQCPAVSIDYAVMEKTDRAAVCPLATSWGDLGAWESFYQLGEKDAAGNVRNGDILAQNARECYLHSSGRLVAALDIEGLAVVETKDAVLVAPRKSLQGVKNIVESLKGAGRPEGRLHTRVFRPWGSYECLSSGDRFQVKRITVNPGASLSLQMHHHRAEHWVVVSGTAEITNGESVGIHTENQSTYIPAGTKHRLRNPGLKPLVLIETQSGSYLGEDDIVRFSDDYGRAPDSADFSANSSRPRDVVILSTADWDNPCWTNKQHMAVQFAEHGWRVLYVDSLGLRQPTLKGRDLGRMGRRLLKAFPWPKQVRPNIWRASPLVLPLHRYASVRGLNDSILLNTLRMHLAALGMKTPLIWTYNPLLAKLCEKLPHSGIVYHCVDDLAAAPRIDAAAIRNGEMELGRVADICFVTSPLLRERMAPLFSRVFYEPNVCEYNIFRSSTAYALPEPPELAAVPHPRLFFVGALSEYKVDFGLVEEVARRMPHVHWVFVGPEGEGQPGSARLGRGPNIHVLGPRPYSELPSFMRHVDAAVLPVTRNPYTDAMFPMKFFEYLAGGLQVVATRLPALAEFEDLYFPADNADEFCEAINKVISGQQKEACRIDRECRKHCWAERFGRMEKILNDIALPQEKKAAHA